ncbi:kinase-like protein, partial [Auricularia subglabra TFB-10046 SS5]
LVAPYMRNGNMLRYIQANPDNNPLGLVIQVAEGLRYLHDNAGIVHGDLKCQNILISGRGDAVLADFGLSTPTTKLESDATTCTTIRWQGTLQFSAPELLGSLSDDDRRQMRSKTVKTDIYAFGMLMLQV